MNTPTSSLVVSALLATALIGSAQGFGVKSLASSSLSSSSSLSTSRSLTRTAAAATRRKETMAEKRARRKARQQRIIDLSKRSKKVSLVDEPAATRAEGAAASSPSSKQKGGDSSATTKAQELIQRQRRSVAMLTLVKERIEKISAQDLSRALADQGYYVLDNFLDHDETVQELEQESIAFMDNNGMTPDIDNLASGEYIGLVRGGEVQYGICPRSIEFVVSTTKHFESVTPDDMNLDSGNCLGRMRTFDRQAFEAAKELLIADDSGDGEAAANENDIDAGVNKASFRCLVDAHDTSDQRRLSLRYYLVPSEWKFGGGIEFENQGLVEARRDRLVVWKSTETAFRGEPWQGDESNRFGSCLELDLIQKTQT